MRTRSSIVATCLVVLITIFPQCGFAEVYDCGFEDPIAHIANLRGRIVFVCFPPDNNTACQPQDLPLWASAFTQDFPNFMRWVSNNKHNLFDFAVLSPPGNPGKAWCASHASSWYQHDCGAGQSPNYGTLAQEIIANVYNAYGGGAPGGIWSNVDVVLFVYYEQVLPTFGGIGNLGIFPVIQQVQSLYAFHAHGTTTCLAANAAALPPVLSSPTTPLWYEDGAIHEYGHALGLNHDDNSTYAGWPCGGAAADPLYINLGHYSVMSTTSPPAPIAGFISYNPKNLQLLGWVPTQEIVPCPIYQVVTVPDVRDPVRGEIIKVRVPGSQESFLLLNHRNASYDSKYGAAGLTIWHESSLGLDLESAVGMNQSGLDPLDADVCYVGTSSDLWAANGTLSFNPTTNPNTNLYGLSPNHNQNIPSNVHIDNIRPGANGDILVDVAVADWGFISPVAGSRGQAGGPSLVNVSWSMCGNSFELKLSDATGHNFSSVATGIAPTPNYPYLIPAGKPAGTGYKFRIIPDGNPNFGVDSDAFAIWDITNASAIPKQVCPSPYRFRVKWTTTLASNGMDEVAITSPTQVPYDLQQMSSSTTHDYFVPVDCESGVWTIYAISRYSESGSEPYGGLAFKAMTYSSTSCPAPCSGQVPEESARAEKQVIPFHALQNPLSGPTTLEFEMSQTERVELVVFDLSGRRVKTLIRGELPRGVQAVQWDGRNEVGSEAPAGMYFVRLLRSARSDVIKILKVS